MSFENPTNIKVRFFFIIIITILLFSLFSWLYYTFSIFPFIFYIFPFIFSHSDIIFSFLYFCPILYVFLFKVFYFSLCRPLLKWGGARENFFFSLFHYICWSEGGGGRPPMHETSRIGNWPRTWLPMKVVGRSHAGWWWGGEIGEWVFRDILMGKKIAGGGFFLSAGFSGWKELGEGRGRRRREKPLRLDYFCTLGSPFLTHFVLFSVIPYFFMIFRCLFWLFNVLNLLIFPCVAWSLFSFVWVVWWPCYVWPA